ncbi:MAG TPA: hypothetical protein VJL58_07305, partial [Pyrinomonadaceae bacterium]|nr:hypothetical protein [Pyrinomonadaceae bacterium]
MVEDMHDLQAIVDSHSEWLLVRENGKSFSIGRSEVEFLSDEDGALVAILDDGGYKYSRVASATFEGNELELAVTGKFQKEDEIIRLVPRTPASQLTANIEMARLEEANRMAVMIGASIPESKVKRIGLHRENGRLAQINCDAKGKPLAIAISDLTASMSAEAILASAMLTLQDAQRRAKKPPAEIWILAEKKSARNLQRLRALLAAGHQRSIRVFELPSPNTDQQSLKEKRRIGFSELWRETPSILSAPTKPLVSATSSAICALAPDQTDIIFSKQGETIRYNGLAIARVRTLLGKEKAWFGIDRERRPLSDESRDDLNKLISDLQQFRTSDCDNKRHDLYRLAPEAWLESILRRNI